MKLDYLTSEKEQSIKKNIPWERLEEKIRDLVQFANCISGIATVQSCEGHVLPIGEKGFHVESANVTFYCTKKRVIDIIFDVAPKIGIKDLEIRYFADGSFWISVNSEPSRKCLLYDFFDELSLRKEGD